MKVKRNDKRVSVRLPANLAKKLERKMEKEGMTITDVVIASLYHYLEGDKDEVNVEESD